MTFSRLRFSRFFAPLLTAVLCLAVFAAESSAEPYWVFFTSPSGRIAGDPVNPALIDAVVTAGYPLRTVSRYFNAVSVESDAFPTELASIAGVERIAPVVSHTRTNAVTAGKAASPAATEGTDGHVLDYGLSFRQLDVLGVPALHDKGLTGNGIVIGVLDAGFNVAGTGCLASVNIAHTKNFVTGGTDVAGDNHGAQVLACIGGAQEGRFYGAAFGATYLLALTDITATETRSDEDRWVAGVEWCDSIGVDIISSSLVYNEFDTVEESYTRADMDGKTSLVAQASEIAFSRGILVVNSGGNEGNTAWGIITTPADAEHVLAVGALILTDTGVSGIASLSSRGPTADGRIKPDVVAPGENVVTPWPGMADYFTTARGTSIAAPLVSGLCALLMEAHPEWTPSDVVAALKNTASDMGDPGPDNIYGWGLPDGLKAYSYTPTGICGDDGCDGTPAPAPIALVREPYPNPFNAALTIPFEIASATNATLDIYSITGQHVARLADSAFSPGRHEIRWTASGLSSGVYYAVLTAGHTRSAVRALYLK